MTPEEAASFGSLGELEELASTRTPPSLWAYVQGGAGEERTVAANRESFRRRRLRPHVLQGVAEIDSRTEILRRPFRSPWYVAPMAYQGDLHPDGELATASAAAHAGCLALFSTLSSRSLESIASAAPSGPRWFQLYLQPEPSDSFELVRRAEKAGFGAIVLTVDAPLFGIRDRQIGGGFAIDGKHTLGNGPNVVTPARAPVATGTIARLREDASVSWEILDELRSTTRLPIVVKGVLRGDDAAMAVAHGAAAIIVSNHGGRQLDGAVAAVDALPEVVAAVGRRAEVYVEGGVRRAADVVIALSLGAKAVGIGRPILWALAVGGEPAVRRYLDLLQEEFVNVLTLLGCPNLGRLGRDFVA